MAHKIQIKRGNKADLPVLNDGEMGLCIDTQEVFIGSNSTNIPVGVQTEIVNNLTETVTGKALDATQGKALAEQISSIPVYTHPTTAGNKHIPTGGTVGQIMTNSASGTAVWSDPVAGVTIVNGLTETVAGKALDATQGKLLNDKIDERTQESCIVTVSTEDSQAVDGQIITLTNVTESTTETYTLGIGETAHTFKIAQNQVYKVKVDGSGTHITPSETAEFTAIASNIRNVAMVYGKDISLWV